VVDRERLLVAAASGPHLAHGLTAPELELESDTTSYEPNYGKASALHALCTALLRPGVFTSGSTTSTTTAASTAAPGPTPYTDYNGFTCASAQANSGGFCPDDPASKPNDQPTDSQPSSAASSTVAKSSTPALAPPPSTTAPAAAPSTSSGCYPLSDENTCYEPGEYCRDDDHGASGVAGDSARIICEDNDGWRWERA
jgi:hypothetical protein